MDRSVTVSLKGALVALVVALALAVAYLLGNAGGSAQAAPTSSPDPSEVRPGTLVTTGTGSAVGVPDQLTFSMSVGLVRPTLNGAMAAANDRMAALLTTLDRLGVRRSDVQTTGLQMNAVYDYHAYSPPTLGGYRVSQRAQVLVRDLTKGGRAVSALVRAGGNDVRVSGLALRIGDTDALLAKSRKDAVAQATAKAREYAAATHQTLGRVLSLREVHAHAPTPRALMLRGTFSADAVKALPIRAGKDKLGVTVKIVWSFR